MFIDITAFKGAIEVENMLLPYKRGTEKITPEVCVEVLKGTNFKRNIKDMLACVLKLPIEEQAQFRKAVLSTFANREQPNEVLVLGKKLAAAGGYEDELGEIAGAIKKGDYLKSAVNIDKWQAMSGDAVKKACLPNNAKVILLGANADFWYSVGLLGEFDFSMCDKVSLYGCDLKEVKKMAFKEGAEVRLGKAKRLPENLDVSMCANVYLEGSDLSQVKKLRFREGSKVRLAQIEKMPAYVDVSMCMAIDMSESNLSGVAWLRFKDEMQMAKSHVKLPDRWSGELVFASNETAAKQARAIGLAALRRKVR